MSYKTSLQTEFRFAEVENGDLELRFDPENFLTTLRQRDTVDSIRLGIRHAFNPASDLIAFVIYRSGDSNTKTRLTDIATDQDGYMAEARYLFRSERFNITGGIGYFNADQKDRTTDIPEPPDVTETNIRQTNFYVYALLNYPQNVTLTVGGSADFFTSASIDRDQFNPKFGLTWNPFPATTLRMALFRVLNRTLIASQTLEPTQVAGFNQFFDDANGTESWRYGIAIDQKLSAAMFGGVELSKRMLEVPFQPLDASTSKLSRANWEEKLIRSYLYWTPHPWLAASGEFQYEQLERSRKFVGPEEFTKINTYRLPFGINFFHPSGFIAGLKATYIDQEGKFGIPAFGPITQGDDRFWVVNATLGYRLPKRWGLLTLEARNLFDARFKFQDTDPANPLILPNRLVFARFTLAF